MPAAATLTSTSSGPGFGTARSASRKTSGPPGAAISMQVILLGISTRALIDSRPAPVNAAGMDEDDFFSSKPVDPLVQVTRQELGPLSIAELHARIETLKAEIARVEEHMAEAERHRSAADELFKK